MKVKVMDVAILFCFVFFNARECMYTPEGEITPNRAGVKWQPLSSVPLPYQDPGHTCSYTPWHIFSSHVFQPQVGHVTFSFHHTVPKRYATGPVLVVLTYFYTTTTISPSPTSTRHLPTSEPVSNWLSCLSNCLLTIC